jgi:hypothetical protein
MTILNFHDYYTPHKENKRTGTGARIKTRCINDTVNPIYTRYKQARSDIHENISMAAVIINTENAPIIPKNIFKHLSTLTQKHLPIYNGDFKKIDAEAARLLLISLTVQSAKICALMNMEQAYPTADGLHIVTDDRRCKHDKITDMLSTKHDEILSIVDGINPVVAFKLSKKFATSVATTPSAPKPNIVHDFADAIHDACVEIMYSQNQIHEVQLAQAWLKKNDHKISFLADKNTHALQPLQAVQQLCTRNMPTLQKTAKHFNIGLFY